ncbi:late competence development ComFB family protein [Oxynema aestuarii]|jgi:gamma-glutamyl phosphate reductase|uniref:Late competence development ComFB family protein n=1 Tax=Oxynema aestuarii AP17 TaxID=2064643 RepID=A0A6H1TTQ4_9CYAN|nr:late competence development ComFB family protein [Oxynema aestuarii]QIZ69984.1 late competence development ComFB family protein [Oxynema aestuarii AP17]RMH77189.1 MAG: hypothetical protein D6680_05985 [Cyanobacteria bacterium J007]
MTKIPIEGKRIHLLYKNAIEPLVVEEVQRQMQRLPVKLLNSLNRDEIMSQAIAYALNRLPSMYATSERGWHFQYQKAIEQFRPQIVTAVRQALAAIQRDPLTPVWRLTHPSEERGQWSDRQQRQYKQG